MMEKMAVIVNGTSMNIGASFISPSPVPLLSPSGSSLKNAVYIIGKK